MSDRVRFATTNDTVTPDNSSGFNGFPTPFLTSVASMDKYPVAAGLDVVDKWFWRGRHWQVATDAFVEAGMASYSAYNGTMNGGSVQDTSIPMLAEAQHAVPGQFGGPGIICASPDSTVSFNIFVQGDVFGPKAPVIFFDGTHYWPFLQIGGLLGVSDTDPDPMTNKGFVSLDVSSDPSAIVAPDGSFNASVDGLLVPMFYKQFGDPGNTATISFLTLSIVEFWPYAARDASAIYNTATGAQLQDPRN